MKKFLALLMAGVMVLSLAACGSSEPKDDGSAEEKTEDTTEDTKDEGANYADTSVAIVLAGSISDNGWNAAGYNAAKAVADKYGTSFAYTENAATSDVEEYLRGYADQGFKMIIAHGSQYIDFVHNVAPDYPDSKFIISYADQDCSQAPNVAGVGNVDGGFLTGFIAGTFTTANKVAFLGGEENPSISAIVDRFEAGVKFANPDCEVITGYIGTLQDADKAKEVAKNVIGQGVDVISASANAAGLGVIQAADEAGILDIGFNSDQYDNAPDAVICSVLRNFSLMFENVFVEVAEGTFEPGIYKYGIGTGNIISDWHGWDAKYPEQCKAVEEFIAGCADGSITY